MMGSGKSEVGRELARLLGRRFVDCDELVAAQAGRSIPEIFAAEGEAGFRRRESETLAGVLAGDDAAVIATGGGVVTVASNRDLLAGTAVCWLCARPEVLADRVGDGDGRPLLAPGAGESGTRGQGGDAIGAPAPGAGKSGVLERLRRLVADREPWYREVADIVVDVEDLSTGRAARAVAARLGELEGWLDGGPSEEAS